jgi:hypothetical protein
MSKPEVVPYYNLSIKLESLFPGMKGPRFTYLGIGSHWGKGKHIVYDKLDGCTYAISCFLSKEELMSQLGELIHGTGGA